ncbi:hypothetical protein KGM_209051 [Danaus plexippus plexippus]|uniref:Secreted protein n=1 Tax=Danaus plexippus plexippus TaxID=278856 RepID=A0A212FCT3_DANPL|nr:hypothetical protein KGM_209051 [Danaus plexippus plexippus]
MRTMLHAVAIVLTVLLLLIRPRYTFAAVCYKRVTTPFLPSDKIKSNDSTSLACHAYYVDPKYKRDPEIDLDDEEIGNQPLE